MCDPGRDTHELWVLRIEGERCCMFRCPRSEINEAEHELSGGDGQNVAVVPMHVHAA